MSEPVSIRVTENLCMGGGTVTFILGPCVIESEELCWKVARAVKDLGSKLGAGVVFKASYDKANRTSAASFRGPGPKEGLRMMQEIRDRLEMPVTTDVHTPEEARAAAEVMDILQIPAFLCRQTDLVVAAAQTGRVVNIKKGQFLAPWDVRPIAEKVRKAGNDRFFFTERGTTFGYNNLVADMRSPAWMREEGFLTCFDATHSVQRPGGGGGHTSGDRAMAPVLARAAMAAGCDAVFMETHPTPDEALSDGPNQMPLNELEAVLVQLIAIHQALH
jgi:2-dehydro-3-deoxyphosphooctonate aldolase (KDO 8-P synthase)